MHLVSYLGYLLGIHKGKQYSYVIISKDKDYDNIIKFWQEKDFKNISRKQKIPSGNIANPKKQRSLQQQLLYKLSMVK